MRKPILNLVLMMIFLASCNDVKDEPAEKPQKETPPDEYSKMPSNMKLAEGYEIRVQRNEQLEYPIFFKGLRAAILFDTITLEKSKISARIDSRTIETGNGMMNAHAKEADVLDARDYPIITFESNSIKKTETGYEAIGNLTLKGITKEIKLPFTFLNNTFHGAFTIATRDFEMTRAEIAPSGQVKIELTVPVTK